ncbi:serine/threonine-protein kinase [Candidatus Blastococcus massiliensis]|uniref:serine/threonine-protein kinase n=1 Tax=Candidatus Blastococcus massiliensis TaxID=1470358 RepID=UPI0004B0AAE3|nr:serine/threonine-protein kinase [Candidatus Blastococcus massiliensis]
MTRPVTAPGRLVAGRYRLQSQIGGGGMGAVWLARDELLGRQVAVKQVLVSETDEALAEQQRLRALREGRIAARLSHPHAISVYDVAQEGETPWLVMEYLPSRSLAEVVTADGLLRVDQVAQIGAQVADALAATHAAGIVHRDVKPANILIGQGERLEGLVKITDFGISHASGDVTLTQTGQITGTPAFLAPEVAQGQEMDEASDVFSLGATLYTCLEGQPPFGMEDNALAMLHKVAGGSIRPPLRAGSLAQPLMRMLSTDPAARPTMAEVRDELARLAAGRSGDTTTVLLARTDLRPATGRKHTEMFPAGAAVLPVEDAAGPPAPPPSPPATPAPERPEAARPDPAPAAVSEPVVDAEPRGKTRRRRGIWLAAALLVAALVGLVAFVISLPDDDGGPQARDTAVSSEAPSSAPDPEPEDDEAEDEDAEGDDTQGGGTEGGGDATEGNQGNGNGNQGNAPQADGDPLSADNVERFLEDYHRQVLENPAQAWDRTGPTLRANISRDNYIRYWQQFDDVRVSDVRATDGQNQATATLEYRYSDGRRETGPHVFTFLVQDGRLILDSDFPVD